MDLNVEWSASSFRITPGRDPLGMQTITTDRIMPELTPGILALSQRAGYLSFHLFLLDEYERQRLPTSRSQMSDFFRSREYDLALAHEPVSPRVRIGAGDRGGWPPGDREPAPQR